MHAECATGQINIQRAVKSRQRKYILLRFTVLCLSNGSFSPFQAVVVVAACFLGPVRDI